MRRGWCPGIHDPMPSGDGWLARVKPRRARLGARALRAVADAAERYGNGVVELTRRGYLQIRGLRAESVGAFAGAMVAAGLADADPARERRRRVICAPPFEDGLAARIEAMQEASADWDRLPDKFAVSVNCADGDIQVIGGRTFVAGGALATRADPVAAVARLVAAGLSLGGGRMSALVAAHGAPALPSATRCRPNNRTASRSAISPWRRCAGSRRWRRIAAASCC
jgi:sulfite reductase beta subunit-like hemoprotein